MTKNKDEDKNLNLESAQSMYNQSDCIHIFNNKCRE